MKISDIDGLDWQKRSRSELRHALEGFLLSQALSQPKKLVVAAPLLFEMPLFDNRAGQYEGLNQDWPRQFLGLGKMLEYFATKGTRVLLVSPSIKGEGFVRDLRMRVGALGVQEHLDVQEVAFHEHFVFLADERAFLFQLYRPLRLEPGKKLVCSRCAREARKGEDRWEDARRQIRTHPHRS